MEQTSKNQQQQFRCTGDCLNCSRVQREYCGAQKGYDNQRLLVEMKNSLSAISGAVEDLRQKIAAIQDNEAMVFDPNNETAAVMQQPTEHIAGSSEGIAQEGDGAKE